MSLGAPEEKPREAPLNELKGFERDLLAVVARLDAPMGIAVWQETKRAYGDTEMVHTRVYAGLDSLVDRGLVRKGSKDGRTNEYRLSDEGEQALEAQAEWLARATKEVRE